MDLVLAAIVGDTVVGQTFFEVLHLLRPPTALLRPRVLALVLAEAIARGLVQ